MSAGAMGNAPRSLFFELTGQIEVSYEETKGAGQGYRVA
jgi:hypothetical protein